MPERSCQGCTKQTVWGCTAKPHEKLDEFGRVIINKMTGKPEIEWTNPAQLPIIFDDEETYACPRQTIRENAQEWSRLLLYYSMFKEGHLPQRGSVSDQSNKAIEALNLMNATNHECDDESMKPKGNPSKLTGEFR